MTLADARNRSALRGRHAALAAVTAGALSLMPLASASAAPAAPAQAQAQAQAQAAAAAPATASTSPVIVMATAFFPRLAYRSLISALEDDGYAVTFVPLRNLGTQAFSEQAKQIDAAVAKVRKETGAPKVSIVAHASSAIGTRYWLKYNGGANQIDTFVSYGAPHHGAAVVGLYQQVAPGLCQAQDACRELQINGPFMKALNTGDETPGPGRYVSIASSADRYVPASSSVLKGATNVVIEDFCQDAPVGHFTMQRGEPVQTAVLQSLSGQDVNFGC